MSHPLFGPNTPKVFDTYDLPDDRDGTSLTPYSYRRARKLGQHFNRWPTASTGTPTQGGVTFPNDWQNSATIRIDDSLTASTLTGFTLYLNQDVLPADMVTSGGAFASQADGADIRVTTDAAGTTQIPVDVRTYTQNADPASASVEIFTRVPTVIHTGYTQIYIWWNPTGTATAPAADSTYGSQNVWQDYVLVLPLTEAVNNNANGYVDRTGNGNHGTGTGMVQGNRTGPLQQTVSNFADDGYITGAIAGWLNGEDDYTIQAWSITDVAAQDDRIISIYDSAGASNESRAALWMDTDGTADGYAAQHRSSSGIATIIGQNDNGPITGWRWVGATNEQGVSLDAYNNGVVNDESASGNASITDATYQPDSFSLATLYEDALGEYDGGLAEARIRKSHLTVDWFLAEYRNMSDPASYITVSPFEGALSLPTPTAEIDFLRASGYAASDYVVQSASPLVFNRNDPTWIYDDDRILRPAEENMDTDWDGTLQNLERVTTSTDVITMPDDISTADARNFSANAGLSSQTARGRIDWGATNVTYNGYVSYQFYGKADSSTDCSTGIDNSDRSGGAFVNSRIYWRFSGTGSILSQGSYVVSASITDTGTNGWYKCNAVVKLTNDAVATHLHFNLTDGTTEQLTTVGADEYSCYFTARQISRSKHGINEITETTGTRDSRGVPLDHDPRTGEIVGAFWEGAQTNRCTYSSNFANASGWTDLTNSSVALTAGATITPKVETRCFTQTLSAGTSAKGLQHAAFTPTGSTTYTLSVFAHEGTHSLIQLAVADSWVTSAGTGYANFDLRNGVMGSVGAATTRNGIEDRGDGWFECWAIFDTAASPTSGAFYIHAINATTDTWGPSISDTGDYYIQACMLVNSSRAVYRFIETDSAEVATDRAYLQFGESATPWITAGDPFSWAVEHTYPEVSDHTVAEYFGSGDTTLMEIGGSTTSDQNGFKIWTSNSSGWDSRAYSNGSNNVIISGTASEIALGRHWVLSGSWNTNDYRRHLNGDDDGTDGTNALPVVDMYRVRFGEQLSGSFVSTVQWIRRFRLWNSWLADEQVSFAASNNWTEMTDSVNGGDFTGWTDNGDGSYTANTSNNLNSNAQLEGNADWAPSTRYLIQVDCTDYTSASCDIQANSGPITIASDQCDVVRVDYFDWTSPSPFTSLFFNPIGTYVGKVTPRLFRVPWDLLWADIVSNSDFSGAGWTDNLDGTYTNAANDGDLASIPGLEGLFHPGYSYYYSFPLTSSAGDGTFSITDGGGTTNLQTNIDNGFYSGTFTVTGTLTAVTFNPSATFNGTIGPFVIRRIGP